MPSLWYLLGPALILSSIIILVMLHILKKEMTLDNVYYVFLSIFTTAKWEKNMQGVVILIFGLCVWVFGQKQKLTINKSGIHYVTGLPSALHKMDSNWSLAWKDIEGVQLHLDLKNNQFGETMQPQLFFHHKGSIRKLNPLLWIIPENRGIFSGFQLRQWRKVKKDELVKKINDTEIMKNLLLNRIPVAVIDEIPGQARAFSIESNTRAQWIVGLLLLLLVYAAWDYICVKQTYTDDILLPALEGGSFTLLAALLSGWWMRKGGVPLLESVGISILLAVAIAFSAYFLLLRINGATSPVPAYYARYRMIESGHFEATDSSLPNFDYFPTSYYWEHINKKGECVFELQKGIPSFYQVNLEVVDRRMNGSYDDYKKSRKNNQPLDVSCDFSL